MNCKIILTLVCILLFTLPSLADGNVIHSWETEQGNCGHKACKGDVTPVVPDTPSVTPSNPSTDTPTTQGIPSSTLFPAQYNHQPIIDSITNNTNSINDLINKVDKNENNIYANSYGVHQNAIDIKDLKNSTNDINNKVIDNSNRIDINSEKILNNTKAIKENSTRIDSNSNAINTLHNQVGANTQSIEGIQKRLDNTNSRINKLDNKLESGLATVTALTSLHPNPKGQGRTQVAVGAGMYRDNVAGAVGIFHFINDNTMLSAGASYGGDHEFAGNVGITFNFGGGKKK